MFYLLLVIGYGLAASYLLPITQERGIREQGSRGAGEQGSRGDEGDEGDGK